MAVKNGDPTRQKSREKPEVIADELRSMIVSGKLSDGASLGRESDLVDRFGVSRPSLREALRILEAEGLVRVVRGVRGGVVVRQPDERITARNAALVLQFRNVTLADVHEARSIIEPAAARMLATARDRRAAAAELRQLIDARAGGDRRSRRRSARRTPTSTSASSRSRATRRSRSSPRC